MRFIARDRTGADIAFDWLDALLLDFMQACHASKRHCSIIIPPELGKTTVARNYLLWWLGNNQTRHIITISATGGQAANMVMAIRSELLEEKFVSVFPDVKPDTDMQPGKKGFRQSEFWLKTATGDQDPTVQGLPVLTRRTGFRVDVLLADDIVSEQTCDGALALKHESAFYGEWLSRAIGAGWCIYLQNPRALGDLCHQLREKQTFASLWLAINDNVDGMTLNIYNAPDGWKPKQAELTAIDTQYSLPQPDATYSTPLPPRSNYTRERLLSLEDLSRDAFNRLFRLKCSAPEDIVFQSWEERTRDPKSVCEAFGIGEYLGLPDFRRVGQGLTFVAGVDLSSRKRKGTVVTVYAIDKLHWHIVSCVAMSGNFVRLMAHFDELWEAGIRPVAIEVEDNALQSMIVDNLAEQDAKPWAAAIYGTTTGRNKFSDEVGVKSMDTDIKSGKLVFYDGETHGDMKHLGNVFASLTHDELYSTPPDSIMATWKAHNAARSVDRSKEYETAVIDIRPKQNLWR